MGDTEARRRRWAGAGLAGYALVVGVVLVAPVSYGRIVSAIGEWGASAFGLDWFGSGWIEFFANVLMFAPLGFLLTLLMRRWWHGLAIAVALSVLAEVLQAVIPSRQPSLRDILANALGAAVGAGVALLIVRRRSRRRSAHSLDSARSEVAEL
ncbi:VanZ family protein [Microbacterium sp.]|uniref:VanZ family protein n=1 Tax=Microbacterium sp. TaxID=51671 RepID=UPI00289D341C|nr:VanZ family protein [Microbacterium sp.]